jgi:hypothetical protein
MISKRMFTKVYVTGALAGGLMLAGASAAMAASPTASVSPSTGLASGQVVQVAASGLTANGSYHVGECAVVSGSNLCDAADHKDLSANGSGALSTPLTVRKSFTAQTTTGGTTTINCATTSCVVGVFDDSANTVASAAISFK